MEEVDVVEELVVRQRVEHAAHVQDQPWKEGYQFGDLMAKFGPM